MKNAAILASWEYLALKDLLTEMLTCYAEDYFMRMMHTGDDEQVRKFQAWVHRTRRELSLPE